MMNWRALGIIALIFVFIMAMGGPAHVLNSIAIFMHTLNLQGQ